MAAIEFVAGSPSPFSNHVVIERTRSGTYRFEGLSNAGAGRPERFMSRHYWDLEDAKLAAAEWATKNGVDFIYIPSAS